MLCAKYYAKNVHTLSFLIQQILSLTIVISTRETALFLSGETGNYKQINVLIENAID